VQQILILQLNQSLNDVYWKTEDAGTLKHTKLQFFQVVNDIAIGKNLAIVKYWSLKSQVLNCSFIEEVNAIVWE